MSTPPMLHAGARSTFFTLFNGNVSVQSCYVPNAPRAGYTELLICHVALTSFNSWTPNVVHIIAYSLNNFRLG